MAIGTQVYVKRNRLNLANRPQLVGMVGVIEDILPPVDDPHAEPREEFVPAELFVAYGEPEQHELLCVRFPHGVEVLTWKCLGTVRDTLRLPRPLQKAA